MKKQSIRYGVATIAAATIISAGLMAPAANAASRTGENVNSKMVTSNMNIKDQVNKITSQNGIDLGQLLAALKDKESQVGSTKPGTGKWTEPSTSKWAEPSTGKWTKPSKGTTTEPSTGKWTKPSTDKWTKPGAGTTTEPSTGTTTEPTTVSDNTASNSDFQSQVVDLVNQERSAAGLSALQSDSLLTKVANAKAEDMEENNYFDHTSPTYGSPFDMMTQFGVTYSYAGENIASGQQTPEEVMNAWMNSEGHRANILSENYNKIGVGYVNGIWVQEFTN